MLGISRCVGNQVNNRVKNVYEWHFTSSNWVSILKKNKYRNVLMTLKPYVEDTNIGI